MPLAQLLLVEQIAKFLFVLSAIRKFELLYVLMTNEIITPWPASFPYASLPLNRVFIIGPQNGHLSLQSATLIDSHSVSQPTFLVLELHVNRVM